MVVTQNEPTLGAVHFMIGERLYVIWCQIFKVVAQLLSFENLNDIGNFQNWQGTSKACKIVEITLENYF